MSKIYRFLTEKDDATFCHKVTKALSEGWQLYGTPTYTTDPKSGELRCGQAVTKDSEEEYHPDKKLSDF